MNRLLAVAALLVVAACSEPAEPAPEPSPDRAQDIAAIEALYADWREAVETGNVDAYAAVLDENVVLMPPGAPDFRGRDTYKEFLKPVFEMASYEIEPMTGFDIEILGDVAVARYDYTVHLSMKDPDAPVQEGALTEAENRSKYFDMLRRQEDGSWKVYRHTWNAAP